MVGLHIAEQGAHRFDREHHPIRFLANALQLCLPGFGQLRAAGFFAALQEQLAVEQQHAQRLVDFMGYGRGLQAAAQLVFEQCEGLGVAEALPLLRLPKVGGERVVALHQLADGAIEGE